MGPLPIAQFEELVADALDEVPAELMALMDNVVVLVGGPQPPTNRTCSASTRASR